MRKGVLEYCILSLVSNRAMYPSDIIEALKKAELIVVEGTLYPLLTRLKNAGLLKYEWVESTSGPPRKYYELTSEGEKVRTTMSETWNRLSTAVEISTRKQNEEL